MTSEQTERVIQSFDSIVKPSRFIRINGELYELAHDETFSVLEHGRMERLRRRIESAWFGEDGTELSPELATVASDSLRELMTLLVPSAVGKFADRTPEPTAENPTPERLVVPVLDTLFDRDRVAIMELFTVPSQRASAIEAVLQLLGAATTDEAPTGVSSQPAFSAPTAPPPAAAVTG